MTAGCHQDTEYDVIIVGAGPAGTTLGYRLARRGLRVLIIEKQMFPRHRIGESLTGETGKMLREMGLAELMEAHGFPVKRGVTVFGPNPKTTFHVPIEARNEAGAFEPTPTWQVRRPEFDQILLDAALAAGAQHLIADARDVVRRGDRVSGVVIKTSDGAQRILTARFVADASGFSTFLSKCGVLGNRHVGAFDKQIAFYAHLDDVRRDEGAVSGNTLLYYTRHLHWSWHIPVSDNRTSVGIVVPSTTFKATGQSPEAFFDAQLKELHPELSDRTRNARRATQVWRRANYSYEIEDFVGPGFVAIGDAHRFLDPIFSFGVWVGFKEAELADAAIAAAFDDPNDEAAAFEEFRTVSNRGQGVIKAILDTFWTYPLAFLRLAHFSHKSEIADLLAGRVFDPAVEDVEAVRLMRDLLSKSNARRSEFSLAG